ncbi:MAG: hypothetical protein IIC51_04390, partial [Planctomycetes bacterium]|nr:hypothetical protein [Planctomycetota bacterium]
IRNDRAKLVKLREDRPDLADLVDAEAMSLSDAIEKASAEAEERKQQRWAATMNIIDSIRPLDRSPISPITQQPSPRQFASQTSTYNRFYVIWSWFFNTPGGKSGTS